jgi:hypothetical protein
MSTRIPVSWLALVVVVGLIAFFGYHIVQASSAKPVAPVNKAVPRAVESQGYTDEEQVRPPYMTHTDAHEQDETQHAEAAHRAQPAPKAMPRVVGQTEEDLRAPEPLQATPPTTQYDPPEATDPMNKNVHMGAEFGSNLRHPEQMIERRPPPSMDYVVPSGLGSERSSGGGNRQVSFAPEFAQNGGEFMQGINAFDNSEVGTGFSMI